MTLAATYTFSLDRVRWGVRYRLTDPARQRRTRNAERLIRHHLEGLDFILQIGATFEPRGHAELPYFLYCDSNIKMAMHGLGSGVSDACFLSSKELSRVIEQQSRVYQQAAGVFTISERLARSFVEDFGLDPARVHSIHAGPNLDISRIPTSPAATMPGRPPTILFVGAQFERKGGDILLRAFRKVRATIQGARLLIVGPERLEVAEPGVVCLGYLRQDDPGDWSRLVDAYEQSDVFCLPTRYEPFGIVFVEAMHFGLPCVGTDTWAIPEIIREGETGYMVPVDDEINLADRLVFLLSNPENARQMGIAGRRLAQTHFTWAATIQRMLNIVTPIINKAAGGAGAPTRGG